MPNYQVNANVARIQSKVPDTVGAHKPHFRPQPRPRAPRGHSFLKGSGLEPRTMDGYSLSRTQPRRAARSRRSVSAGRLSAGGTHLALLHREHPASKAPSQISLPLWTPRRLSVWPPGHLVAGFGTDWGARTRGGVTSSSPHSQGVQPACPGQARVRRRREPQPVLLWATQLERDRSWSPGRLYRQRVEGDRDRERQSLQVRETEREGRGKEIRRKRGRGRASLP